MVAQRRKKERWWQWEWIGEEGAKAIGLSGRTKPYTFLSKIKWIESAIGAAASFCKGARTQQIKQDTGYFGRIRVSLPLCPVLLIRVPACVERSYVSSFLVLEMSTAKQKIKLN